MAVLPGKWNFNVYFWFVSRLSQNLSAWEQAFSRNDLRYGLLFLFNIHLCVCVRALSSDLLMERLHDLWPDWRPAWRCRCLTPSSCWRPLRWISSSSTAAGTKRAKMPPPSWSCCCPGGSSASSTVSCFYNTPLQPLVDNQSSAAIPWHPALDNNSSSNSL